MKVPLHHSEVVGAHLHQASSGVSPVQLEEVVQVDQEVLLYQVVVAEVVMVMVYLY